MKSVFKTFSQSTLNVMTKACLTALCVFVLSSVGSAQSFMEGPEAAQVLKPFVTEIQIDFKEKNQGALVNPRSTDELIVRYYYFTSLAKYFSGPSATVPVRSVIEKNHVQMTNRYNALETPPTMLTQLKQEAINLLTN